jgi:hypothetical protein
MGVDTKGYVITPVKNVMHVMTMVEDVILKMVLASMPPRQNPLMPEGFALPRTRLAPSTNMAQTSFSIAGENRLLTVHFGCDNDNSAKYPGEKLILSIGRNGLSVEVMEAVLARLTHLGRCYLDRDDCDNEPDVEITTAPMTFIDAVVQQYDNSLNSKHWMRMHAELANARPLSAFLGITPKELLRVKADDSAIYGICDAYCAAAKSSVTPELS